MADPDQAGRPAPPPRAAPSPAEPNRRMQPRSSTEFDADSWEPSLAVRMRKAMRGQPD